MPKSVYANVKKTAVMAEAIRAALGDRPLRIASWYRCKIYNAKVGGVPNSQHLLGNAIDFVIRELSPMQVQLKCRELQAREIVGGLGMYPGFTHCDRGEARWWNERNRLMSARVPPNRIHPLIA